jgi:hypothetical protein
MYSITPTMLTTQAHVLTLYFTASIVGFFSNRASDPILFDLLGYPG